MMKQLKKSATFFTVALSMLMALQVAAQPGGERGPRGQRGGDPEKRIEKLTQALNLSTEQQEQFRALDAEMRQNMEALRESGKSREEMRAEAEKHKADMDKKYQEILSDDQYAEFKELREKRMQRQQQRQGQRRGQGNGEMPPPPPGE